MMMTSCPGNAYNYLFSKIWFKNAVIDLRKSDINMKTSAIKSWLYQPKLVKHQKEILYREIAVGGLGILVEVDSMMDEEWRRWFG